MKTNFLYFRELGSQTFTYVTGGQTFTLADAGGANFDEDIANDLRIRVNVTFKEAQTTKCGSAYSGGSVDAGETVTVNATGKSMSGAVVTIVAQTADGTNGITLTAGDIVTITTIPVEGTEAMFRADRFLGVETNGSNTETVVSFKSLKSNAAAAGDDTVTFTYASETTLATGKAIALAIDEALNANSNGGVVDVYDRANNIGTASGISAITKMIITIA